MTCDISCAGFEYNLFAFLTEKHYYETIFKNCDESKIGNEKKSNLKKSTQIHLKFYVKSDLEQKSEKKVKVKVNHKSNFFLIKKVM